MDEDKIFLVMESTLGSKPETLGFVRGNDTEDALKKTAEHFTALNQLVVKKSDYLLVGPHQRRKAMVIEVKELSSEVEELNWAIR